MNIKPLDFQYKAIAQLREAINALWTSDDRPQIILHSPTGSGKTLMTCAFIDSLQEPSPEDTDLGDVAYFWITLNNELAMQSKDKFFKYFAPNLRNTLSTFDDCSDTLRQNEILFVNWQKLSQKRGKDRLLLRRPTTEEMHKESGFYFEELMENTHRAGRKIIMVIDESHSNVGTDLSQEIIDYVNPKLILKVSATPFKDKTAEKDFIFECYNNRAALVKVDDADVVAAGLIKEEIVGQTAEDLSRFEGGDIDNTMLALAKQKRDELKNEWHRLGYDINPLVLIQLPNDEGKIIDGTTSDGAESKEAFTRRVLRQNYGIADDRIATWLADKPLKPEWRISDNDSPIDFLIFKYAAGTGWDCPRAHILVMFREIKSPVFHTQTLGRIKRMPINGNELNDSVMLRRGYLYTTYKNNEIAASIDVESPNKPKTQKTTLDAAIKQKAIVTTLTKEIGDILTQNTDDQTNAPVSDPQKAEDLIKETQKIWETEINKPIVTTQGTIDFGDVSQPSTDKQEKEIKAAHEQKAKFIAEQIISKTEQATEQKLTDKQKTEIKESVQIAVETQLGNRASELILDPALKTQFLSRADYGDLGKSSQFQQSFLSSMHKYFGTKGQTLHKDDKECLESCGIELNVSPTWQIMLGKVYRFAGKDEEGTEANVKISTNDISHLFNSYCLELLKANHIGNVKRSWSVLSQALRQWFTQLIITPGISDDQWRRIFIYDLQKEGNSAFSKAIAQAINDYRPILREFIRKREEEALHSNEPFKIQTSMAFDNTHETFEPSSKSIQQPFYLLKNYNGRDNETSFIRFLENNSDVEHWFKNGSSGKNALAIRYTDTKGTETTYDDEIRLFHPDWIVLYKNGDIGIYDTKGGITSVSKSQETRDKLAALMARIDWLNHNSTAHHYRGGIYEAEDGGWKLKTSNQ